MATNVPNSYYGALMNSFVAPRMFQSVQDFRDSDLYNAAAYGDSDAMNYFNSEMAAFRDILKWNATNEWNLEQWDRENEYNSPVNQMLRYMEAGINPLWAMNDNPGNAQHLTSQQPASFSPIPMTMDSERLDLERSNFMQSNALQSAATMGELSIKERALRNEIRSTDSQLQKTKAETDLLKSQLESNDYLNKINSVTFDTQVNLKIEELNQVRQTIRNLEEQENLTKDQEELLKAQKEYQNTLVNYTQAMAKKVESETFDKLENLKIKWFELLTARKQAQAAATSAAAAQTTAEAALQNSLTNDAALSHQIEKDQQEMREKSNSQIIQLIDMQRGFIDRFMGLPSNFFSGSTGHKDFEMVHRAFSILNAGYKEISGRFYSNPTKSNADAMDHIQKLINNMDNRKFDVRNFFPSSTSNTSVINNSPGWLQ